MLSPSASACIVGFGPGVVVVLRNAFNIHSVLVVRNFGQNGRRVDYLQTILVSSQILWGEKEATSSGLAKDRC